MNSITFFIIIENLFNYSEQIFDNLDKQKYTMAKFRKLKMKTNILRSFILGLDSDLEYIY